VNHEPSRAVVSTFFRGVSRGVLVLSAFLVACSATLDAERTPYRAGCDRNGDREQRVAC